MHIRSVMLQRLKSQNQRDILYKVKTLPRLLKRLIHAKKEGGTIILAVVLLLLLAPCPGDAVFHCESKTTTVF